MASDDLSGENGPGTSAMLWGEIAVERLLEQVAESARESREQSLSVEPLTHLHKHFSGAVAWRQYLQVTALSFLLSETELEVYKQTVGANMRRSSLIAAALIIAVGGCSDEGTGPNGDLITLSASQAAALVARVESFAVSDPSIGSISDTIGVVVKAGAEARRVVLTTDLGTGEFYAVSLHMPNTQSSPASATFHFIAFDDVTNPTQFVILGGWSATGAGGAAPTVVSGQIGADVSTSLTGHLFSISGNQVSAWHASAGNVILESRADGGACSGFTGPGTCVKGSMDVGFSLTTLVPGNGAAGQRTASGNAVNVPGIRLTP